MLSKDPRINPETANVIGHDHHTPYAWRSVRTVFGFVFAVFVVGAFLGWYFFTPSSEERERKEAYIEETAPELPDQMPGNRYKEGSGRSGVYNFFYKVFGGIEDGLEENPHNLENVEHIDDYNIDTDEVFDDNIAPTLALDKYYDRLQQKQDNADDNYRHSVFDVVGSDVMGVQGDKAGEIHDILINKKTGKAIGIVIDEDGQSYERDLTALRFRNIDVQQPDGDVRMTVTEDTLEERGAAFDYSKINPEKHISLRSLRDGQVIDVDKNVVGQIDAVIYQNAKAQQIYFELRPAIAAETSTNVYALPYDALNIVKSADGYDIKLDKEQTKALAKTVIKDIEN